MCAQWWLRPRSAFIVFKQEALDMNKTLLFIVISGTLCFIILFLRNYCLISMNPITYVAHINDN
jgi:hypothetical protein